MIRHVPWILRQAFSRLPAQACSKSSSVVSASIQCSEPTDKGAEHTTATNEKLGESNESGVDDSHAHDRATRFRQARGGIVAAAFASLKEDENSPVPGPKGKGPQRVKKNKSYVDAQIAEADSVEALLKVAELPSISRHHALRIISVLSEWSASGRVKLADFEGDMRFIKLCHILGKNVHGYQSGTSGSGNLAMVLGVTGDDEAAKLVAGISLPQMIKVMSTLAQKRRRSTPLLRSLAFNLGRQEKQLDMKQCADVLYAASVLNFPDDVLLEKVCSDLCECAPTNTKSAVVRSVVTSLGLLRYKHTGQSALSSCYEVKLRHLHESIIYTNYTMVIQKGHVIS
ncbi:hypothetical protein PR048_000467 [Dryococelus australis]|uniref:Uncharacterized protein n=1 Tax=Dryococelus australis TaxID=614101 RepID=A0ABQ9IEP4_9NEOP|nr:hypothetical protein PR048_000467 [Dryococelus australis]